MQTKQAKTQNPRPVAESAELTKKVASSAADSARLPAWTNAWGDQPPAALISPIAELQAKHLLSQPEDPYERQADHIANHVMDMAASSLSLPAAPSDHPGTSPLVAASLSHVPPIIQRAPLDDSSASTPTESTQTTPEAAPTSTTPSPEAAPETASPALIVEDSAEQLAPGQMKKSDFLAQLRPAVCTTAEEALQGTIWSAAGCPWIDHWFAYYSNRDSQQIERALRRYAPETARVSSASDYIPIICERVRRGIGEWSATGEVPGLPEGIDLPNLGIMGLAGRVASGIASVGSSIASGVESVASGIASVGSSIASGVGSVVSGIGSLFSKGREGGAREAANPQAIQGQLGAGRSLDGGVRSQMEPAFGADFSRVHIHTDAKAAGLSESLNARAFTVGSDVAFGPGEYRPGTFIGDALIAHELAHVVQQGSVSPSSEPLQKGGAEYNSLEEDADVSAVGAVVSMWSGAKGMITNITQHTLPGMRSGLRLQRCAGTQRQPTTANALRQPATARPPTVIANWRDRVRAAKAIDDPTRRRDELLGLVTQALSGTNIQVSGGNSPVVGGSNPLGEVNPDDYQEAPTLNFDLNLNRRTGKADTDREAANIIQDVGYFFTSGERAYAIIGPLALNENSPDYTRMYVEHELYHTSHHAGSSKPFNERELEVWTLSFLNYFHLLYPYRMRWSPLITYYQNSRANARRDALDALTNYYNNPPVPATPEQGSREAFTQRLKRVFGNWLRRQLKNPVTRSQQLIQDLEGRLHLGNSPVPQGEEGNP